MNKRIKKKKWKQAAAQAAKAAKAAQEERAKEWELSERELWLIEQLNKRKDAD